MIYTLGCSFTKWFWPTWADWLQEYQGPVTNLAWPGASNETMYWELLNRSDTITTHDRVYIMLTGNNRVSTWYDKEWIDRNDVEGFFPRQDGQLEFGVDKWKGMYRLHPDHDVSLSAMIIDNFNIILQIQNLLENIGCAYKFVFWQNPWFDIRPVIKPRWQYSWPSKDVLTTVELATAQSLLRIKPVRTLISLIKWNNFYLPPTDILDPCTYSGMWEYRNKKISDPEYLKYVHSDPHPDSLLQHDFLIDVMLGNVNKEIREKAKQCALESLLHTVIMPKDTLITNDFSSAWPKFCNI